MNKIIAAALAAKYNASDVQSLIEIINATPNPTMATELLLGCYEPLTLPTRVKNSKGDVLTMLSRDNWKNEVVYTTVRNKTKSGWFPAGTLKEDITLENFDNRRSTGGDVHIVIETGELETITITTSFEGWLKFEPLPRKEHEDIFA